MQKVAAFLFSGVVLMTSGTALAHEKGDILLRVGATMVEPNDEGKPDGVWVDDNTQLGLSLAYLFTDNIGIEVLGATPFNHDIVDKASGNKIGTTRHLPPTVSVQYYFNNASVVTPYVGVGANYTMFFDEKLGASNIELKDSFGAAFQVGVDIALDSRWGINLDIRKIAIDTEVEGVGVKVDVDPVVYSLMASYRF